MEKIKPKFYKTEIQYQEDELYPYYFITIPDELIDELGWNEETPLVYDLKMGPKGNIVIIRREND